MGTTVPKLNLEPGNQAQTTKNANPAATASGHKRRLSESSRGSIGRKERLRNALTGRSDGSEGGQDEPKELPDEELVDFVSLYDKSDPFSYKLIKKLIERKQSMGSFEGEQVDAEAFDIEKRDEETTQRSQSMNKPFEGGSEENLDLTGNPQTNDSPEKQQEQQQYETNMAQFKNSDSSNSQYKEVDIVSFPSLDDALEMKFDVNSVTSIAQRLRNINCQPRTLRDLYPAPFHLLTKREKRCKNCHKFVIKPNMNPSSNEKMKSDY